MGNGLMSKEVERINVPFKGEKNWVIANFNAIN